eukprot:6200362-Pleurochrysis_carterae.AAC.1
MITLPSHLSVSRTVHRLDARKPGTTIKISEAVFSRMRAAVFLPHHQFSWYLELLGTTGETSRILYSQIRTNIPAMREDACDNRNTRQPSCGCPELVPARVATSHQPPSQ